MEGYPFRPSSSENQRFEEWIPGPAPDIQPVIIAHPRTFYKYERNGERSRAL